MYLSDEDEYEETAEEEEEEEDEDDDKEDIRTAIGTINMSRRPPLYKNIYLTTRLYTLDTDRIQDILFCKEKKIEDILDNMCFEWYRF